MIAGSTKSRNICTHMLLCNLFSTFVEQQHIKGICHRCQLCAMCTSKYRAVFISRKSLTFDIAMQSHSSTPTTSHFIYSLRPGKEIISLNGSPFFSTTIKICCERYTQLESAIIRFIAECLCTELDSFWFAKKNNLQGHAADHLVAVCVTFGRIYNQWKASQLGSHCLKNY